jgi:S-DNA-T family DNA segregation ATPase FtsK/SpoIIIE
LALEEPLSMIVTLLTQERTHAITLPEKVRGQFWLRRTERKESSKLISIEAVNGEWILKSNRKISVEENKQAVKTTALKTLSIYILKVEDSDERLIVFTEPRTGDRQIYAKYLLDRDTEISIGRVEKNDIVINNEFISGQHAKIVFANKQWSIHDNGSTNGTFVNGLRVINQRLNIGDVVYLMGFKLIIGNCFIAINNPDGKVEFVADKLHPFPNQEIKMFDDDDDETNEGTDYFYRSPRFKRDIERAVFQIDSPPQNAAGEEMPFIMVIGPSMTMGLASMTTAIFAINNAMSTGNISGAMPSIVMSASMLLGTVLWPVLSKRFEKRRKAKKEALRQKKYKEYLDRISIQFSEECEKQAEILRENFVPINDCVARIQNVQRNLWERGFGQNDFLTLRTGLGNGLLEAEISYNERKFTIDEDNLQEELYTLCEKPKVLRNIPVTWSLYEDYISGLIGERGKTKGFVKGLIFQLASLYSYDEVKMVFLYDRSEEADFGFAKWLPHVWSGGGNFRFIATDPNEAKEVSAYIEREIENRSDINEGELDDIAPYYIIFALNKAMADRVEMLKQIYARKKNLHFSVISVFDELKNLPKECTMVVELDESGGRLFDKNDISGKTVPFTPDIFLPVHPETLSISLSNVHLDTLAGSFKLPKMITFLEMFGVGKVEHLNALSRWNDNDPTKSLEAAVGVDTMGELFRLDLHEKFHGPHGLVAGMTGSGKSEFIITYILSLAVNYHPNEVAFILIDYKGGGMAKSFENLPHTAGIITNLDGAAIKRSLISIESELKRRQAIFAKAGKEVGVSNIDIYKYQKLYREGTVSEPLQHLFIISDEFAELKTQQPEFMTQLVSAARIGRSLGVHLILATQKPAGVVDDQIWSNSKFRVCLKVQERADSMDMLKRPDAAELTDTGRFYLQVGYNELFEMGQSSWAGAPYYPSDKVLVEKDNSVVVIDRNGRPVREAKTDNKKRFAANPQKQLDVITEYLRVIAEEENIKIRPLWLEPIPAMILLDTLRGQYPAEQEKPFELNPVIGEYDDPARQRQCVLRLPVSDGGNIIVYGGAGSGKTTFLNTVVYSLITNHTPDEVHIYLLDFASETLRAFSKAPHVGNVVLSFEGEVISNLFKMLKDETERRKKLFADYGGDYRSYITATGEKLPSIVVAINNFAAFTEMYEGEEERALLLTREGTKYGVFFIITALSTNGVRYRMQQNFKQLYVLQMNDESDYVSILGRTDGLYPSKHKGRGLFRLDELHEFQIAQVTDAPVPFAFLQQESCRLNGEWNGKAAPKIPILPEQVDAEFLSEYIDLKKPWNVPVGVNKHSLLVHYYPFGQSYISQILSAGDEGQLFLYDLAMFYSRQYALHVILLDGAQAFADKDRESLDYYSGAAGCEKAVTELYNVVAGRQNAHKEALEKGEKPEPFEQKAVLINSVATLKSILPYEIGEKLTFILENGDKAYNITVVFAESIGSLSGVSYDGWYTKHVSTSDGIWAGDGIMDQYQLKLSKISSDMRDEVPFGFGFAVQKGKAAKVKLLCSEKGEEEDDA